MFYIKASGYKIEMKEYYFKICLDYDPEVTLKQSGYLFIMIRKIILLLLLFFIYLNFIICL